MHLELVERVHVGGPVAQDLVHLISDLLNVLGVLGQQVEGPGQGSGGRLVAGHHELKALHEGLVVGHHFTGVGIRCVQHHAQDIAAATLHPSLDVLPDELVGIDAHLLEPGRLA